MLRVKLNQNVCRKVGKLAQAILAPQGPLVARHLSKNSKLYSIDHLIIFQRAIFGLNSEMKSRKEINKQNYQHDATYSPAQSQRKRYYNPAQRKLQHKATYSPAQRKLEYIQQKSASAQKVRNEQFCNRSTRSTSTSNQADIKLPIEIRESLKHAIKCDQKSMQVEGRVDAFCLPVCLICDRVIFGCETVHKVDKEAVLATKSKFSIEEYNSFYDMELHAELIRGIRGVVTISASDKDNQC
eukprot:scaffold7500_cov92-Skeletonema_marinoi.AAC.1